MASIQDYMSRRSEGRQYSTWRRTRHETINKLFEQQTRHLAQRSSRRGMLKAIGGLLVGAGTIPAAGGEGRGCRCTRPAHGKG